MTKRVEEAVWDELGVDAPVPESLGKLDSDSRDEPLALTQLVLLYHLIQAREALTTATARREWSGVTLTVRLATDRVRRYPGPLLGAAAW